jgi:hypothetical protein
VTARYRGLDFDGFLRELRRENRAATDADFELAEQLYAEAMVRWQLRGRPGVLPSLDDVRIELRSLPAPDLAADERGPGRGRRIGPQPFAPLDKAARLISTTKLSISRIAKLAGVTEYRVKDLRARLKPGGGAAWTQASGLVVDGAYRTSDGQIVLPSRSRLRRVRR